MNFNIAQCHRVCVAYARHECKFSTSRLVLKTFSEASWALVVHSFSLFAGLHKIPQNTNSQPDFSTTSGQCQVFGYESCVLF